MEKDNKDYIDLNPYFKLFKITFSNILNWLLRNLWLMVIVFVIIVGLMYTYEKMTPTSFKTVGFIKNDQVKLEKVKSVLKSVKANLKTGHTPSYFKKYQLSEDKRINLFDLKYSIDISFLDSIIINSRSKEDIDLEKLEYDYPISVELISNSKDDSLGFYFIDYLNAHPIIQKSREARLNKKGDNISTINAEISSIDSIVRHLLSNNLGTELPKDSREGFLDKNSTIYNFVALKDKLLREKIQLENQVKHQNEFEIVPVTTFSKQVKVNQFTIFNIRTLVKCILLSIIVVLFIHLFFRSIKLLKK